MTISPISAQKNFSLSSFFANRVTLVAISVLAGIAIGWSLKAYFTNRAKTRQQPENLPSGARKSEDVSGGKTDLTLEILLNAYKVDPHNISLFAAGDYTCKIDGKDFKIEKPLLTEFLKKLSDKMCKSENAEEIANAMAKIDRVIPLKVQEAATSRLLATLRNKPIFKWTVDSHDYELIVNDESVRRLRDAYNRYLILTKDAMADYFLHFEKAAETQDFDTCKMCWNWFVERDYRRRVGPNLTLNKNGNQITLKAGSYMYCNDGSSPKAFDQDGKLYTTVTHTFDVKDPEFADKLATLA